jgi:hypothetical protein
LRDCRLRLAMTRLQQGFATGGMGLEVSLHGSNPGPLNVRFGSKADIASGSRHVRFTPKSGHRWVRLGCPLCAKSRHSSCHADLL